MVRAAQAFADSTASADRFISPANSSSKASASRFPSSQTKQLLRCAKATATDEPIANSRYHGWTSSTCFTQDRDDVLCRLAVQSPSRRNLGQVGNATFPCARTSSGRQSEGGDEISRIAANITQHYFMVGTFQALAVASSSRQ